MVKNLVIPFLLSILFLTTYSTYAQLSGGISGPNPTGKGSTQTYTYTGELTPLDYKWIVSGGTKVSYDADEVTIKWSSSASSGSILYTNSARPATTYASLSVSLVTCPTKYTVGGGGSYCSGGSGKSITLSGSQSGASYQLKIGSSNIGSPKTKNGGKITWSGLKSQGTYKVFATKNGCTEEMNGSKSIVINPLPTKYNVSGGGSYCSGSSGKSITLSDTQLGVAYSLLENGVGSGELSIEGTGKGISWTNVKVSSGTKTFKVRATNNSTLCSVETTSSKTITVKSLPTNYTVGGGGSYCSGGSGKSITLSNSQASATYQLKRGSTNVGAAKTDTGGKLTWSGQKTAGTYTVVATGSNGCTRTMSGSKTISVTSYPTSYSLTGGGSYCSGGSGRTLTLFNSETGVTYQLRKGSENVGSAKPGKSGTSLTWTNNTAGTYTVWATRNGCSKNMSNSAVITAGTAPQDFTVSGSGYCLGSSGGIVTVSGTQGGASYQLKKGATNIGMPILASGSGEAIYWDNLTTAGTYTVQASRSGCTRLLSGSAVIDGYAVPQEYTLSGGGGLCTEGGAGDSFNIKLSNSQSGMTYQLVVNGTPEGEIKNGNGLAITWAGRDKVGTYKVLAKNNSCELIMASQTNIEAIPEATKYDVNGGGSYCPGDDGVAIYLSDSQKDFDYFLLLDGVPVSGSSKEGNGYGIFWSDLTAPGIYTVKSVDMLHLCSATMEGEVEVSMTNLPDDSFQVSGGGIYCSGEVNSSIHLNGNESEVDYVLLKDGVEYPWDYTVNSDQTLSWNDLEEEGEYSVKGYRGSCSDQMTGTADIFVIQHPIIKSFHGEDTYCSSDGGAEFTLDYPELNVGYQLMKDGNEEIGEIEFYIPENPKPGEPISDDPLEIVWSNIEAEGLYTVVGHRNVCTKPMNGSIELTRIESPVAQALEGNNEQCDPGILFLESPETDVVYKLYKDNEEEAVLNPGEATWLGLVNGLYSAEGHRGMCMTPMINDVDLRVKYVAPQLEVLISNEGKRCENDEGVVISVDGSSDQFSYSLYKQREEDEGDPSLEFIGTREGNNLGSAINWSGVKQAGTYEVHGFDVESGVFQYLECPTDMLNTVTVEVEVLPNTYALSGGGSVCFENDASDIILENSQEAYDYYLYVNGGNDGSFIEGTGGALVWEDQFVAGEYKVLAKGESCSLYMDNAETISVNDTYPLGLFLEEDTYFCTGFDTVIELPYAQTEVGYQLIKNETELIGGLKYYIPRTGPDGEFLDLPLTWTGIDEIGTYTIEATLDGCTRLMNGDLEVEERPMPAPLSISGPHYEYQVHMELSEVATEYQLFKNELEHQSTQSGNGETLIWDRLLAGTYKVQADKNGCFDIMDNTVVISGCVTPPGRNAPASLDQNFIRKEVVLKSGIETDTELSTQDVYGKTTSYEYFDGLGRALQSVNVGGSPTQADIIQHYVYDDYGRQEKEFLPYSKASGQSGAYRTSAETEQSSFYSASSELRATDANPWVLHEFEESPLNRVLKTYGAGEEWQTANDKSTQFALKTNGSNTVRKWILSGGLPERDGYHAANTLLLNETTTDATDDPSENQIVREYTDTRGLVVLKQVRVESGKWLKTNYIYDDWGSVVMVLPPELSNISSPTADDVDQLAFQYQYDEKRRVEAKKLPGTLEWNKIIYDKWNRVVMTQDANQTANYEYLVTKYDEYNRPILTGLFIDEDHEDTDHWRFQVTTSSTRFESRTETTDYTSVMSPKPLANNVYSVTYYDDYTFLDYSGWGNEFDFESESGFAQSHFNSVKGQTTGSKVKVLGGTGNTWLKTVTYYDNKYRVLQTITENIRGGVDRTTFEYDFVGKVLKSLSVQTNDEQLSILKEYEYDHAGRLLRTWQTLASDDRILLAENSYNELGEMVTKKLHSENDGADFLQTVDYRYNIRGWLTQINDPSATDPERYFAMALKYTDGATPHYDGNIGTIDWLSPMESNKSTYDYTYDGANRILAANYSDTDVENLSDFDVSGIAYDDNGNIKTLARVGDQLIGLQQGEAGATIDDLSYVYRGNQLIKVSDADGVEEGFKDGADEDIEYEYDANGNMIEDLNKGITGIEYNHLNLPAVVSLSNVEGSDDSGQIKYLYDAAGIKLAQIVERDGTEIKRTDYEGAFIYESKNEATSQLQFIQHDEGRIVPVTASGSEAISSYDYQYFLKDHLGNVRVTFKAEGDVEASKATFEPGEASNESSYFIGYDGMTKITADMFNNTAGGNTSIRLNGREDEIEGLGKSIMVKPGDVIDLEVYAKYFDPSDSEEGWDNLLTTLAANLADPTKGLTVDGGGMGEHAFPFADWTDKENPNNLPRAYMNYMVFDQNFKLEFQGFKQITTDAKENGVKDEDGDFKDHEKLSHSITIEKAGYVYVYLSNEQGDTAPIDVFFDDFKITHHHTPIVQKDDYYPFGLTFNG
ncbi:DUF6443 domain-containing protein, partial [Reichenbachiella sp.]